MHNHTKIKKIKQNWLVVETEINEIEDVVVLSISGRLDSLTAGELERTCSKILKDETDSVLLKLKKLEYISSAGLQVIFDLAKKLKTNNKNLKIAEANEHILNIFEMSGLTSLVPPFSTVEEALGKKQ